VKKTTLAVPAGSPRVAAFIAEAVASGRSVAELAVVEPGHEQLAAPSDGSGGDGFPSPIPWNPMSFASARAAIVEAETALGGSLDELVVFVDPPGDSRPVAELSPKEIEASALTWAAGHVELIRETARRFGEKNGGTIVLVIVHEERGPLGAVAENAMMGLAEGMLTSAQAKVRFIAFRDESSQPELLAKQLARSLDETVRDSGRVQRFGGKSGFFNRG
jgi:hypothetical protein